MVEGDIKEAQKLQKLIIFGLASNYEKARYFRIHERIKREPFMRVDKGLALELLKWVKENKASEFPELADIDDWADFSLDNVTDDFIRRLRKLGEP